MYIPGSPHLEWQKKLGKVFTSETLKIKRFALNTLFDEKLFVVDGFWR